jgi:hypothetical protein
MAKRVIVTISPDDLKTVGSGVLPELQKLSYPANSIGMANATTYYIAGKKYISQFVAAMLKEIEDCAKTFTDEQSAVEFECDRAYLKALLEVKAK